MKLKLTFRDGLARLSVLGLVVGVFTGGGAVAFRDLIGFLHNLAFEGRLAIPYNANLFTPTSPWGAFIILVPVIGALFVTFLIVKFAPEARGHGVPEVMDAIHYHEGVIRPIVAVIKSLASAISIGTGAAVGREGPIIQIGSSLASTLGQIIPMPGWQRITLVAAGAGAGIAATFNTPIGGVMFAVELMLPEVSARTFLPVALATGTATFMGQIFFGFHPAFEVPTHLLLDEPATVASLMIYALLGALAGLAGTAFIFGVEKAGDWFDRIPNPYLRHSIGMLSIGVLIYVLHQSAGHYFVEGVGYATIEAILTGGLAAPLLLAVLFVAKLYATSVSLGSGASGGIFSPSLFMGATLGAGVGGVAAALAPGAGVDVPSAAIVGMAAVVGGGTGAAMTAVTMIFEMTRDYALVMPSIIAVAVAVGVRRLLSRESIYTAKLTGRGHYIPEALHANMFMVRHANQVMERDVIVLPDDTDFGDFLRDPRHAGKMKHVVVTRGDRIVGCLRVNMAFRAGVESAYAGVKLGDLAHRRFILAADDHVVFDILTRMARRQAVMAIITQDTRRPRAQHVVGVLSREHLGDSVIENIRQYGD
jgi:chloride channel protein, CIC family